MTKRYCTTCRQWVEDSAPFECTLTPAQLRQYDDYVAVTGCLPCYIVATPPDRSTTLQESLDELEATDPEVRQARVELDKTCKELLSRGRCSEETPMSNETRVTREMMDACNAWTTDWFGLQRARRREFRTLVLNAANKLEGLAQFEAIERACDLEMTMRDDGDCPLTGDLLEELRTELNLTEDGLTQAEHQAVCEEFVNRVGAEAVDDEGDEGKSVIVSQENKPVWEELEAQIKAGRTARAAAEREAARQAKIKAAQVAGKAVEAKAAKGSDEATG